MMDTVKNCIIAYPDGDEKIKKNYMKKTGLNNLPEDFYIKKSPANKAIALLLAPKEKICPEFFRHPNNYDFHYSATAKSNYSGIVVWGKADPGGLYITLEDFYAYWTGEKQWKENKLPKINGYEGQYLEDQGVIKYGCAEIDRALIETADELMHCGDARGNRTVISIVLSSGVILTAHDIEDIMKLLRKQGIKGKMIS